VPATLLDSSQDLYAAVQNFFRAVLGNTTGQRRQLIVGGESYAGKFVPGLGELRPTGA
jgi:carboxypeptidase C (cathepsin A)